MKNEKNFLILSFIIIFILLFSLISVINYDEYKKAKHHLKDNIKQQLEICSYKLNCSDIKVNFAKIDKHLKPFILEENKNNYYELFKVKDFTKYYLKLAYPKDLYNKQLSKLKQKIIRKFLVEFAIILVLTFIFVYILLIPLRKAYKINETFIKDILHDFNTPLTTLKLNLFLLKKEIGYNERIEKIEQNISAVLKYQENLKTFLSNNKNQIDIINLKELIDEKLKFYSTNYPNIKYKNEINCTLSINKNAFNSILDNLISNAFKYNKTDGEIKLFMKDKKLYIQDSGIGIKNPNKVFDRFYKENQRGVGIGMNIVKKFCDELKIPIKIKSQINKGSTIILDLKKYC